MRTLKTHIRIPAPPKEVWDVLMDFPAYPEWNPFIREVRGEPVVGTRLRILLTPTQGEEHRFRPRVLQVIPPREFRWRGSLGIPGLFDGEHIFRLEAVDGGRETVLHHEEEFQGILVPLLWPKLEGKTRAGFEAMNRALRERVEGGPGPVGDGAGDPSLKRWSPSPGSASPGSASPGSP